MIVIIISIIAVATIIVIALVAASALAVPAGRPRVLVVSVPSPPAGSLPLHVVTLARLILWRIGAGIDRRWLPR